MNRRKFLKASGLAAAGLALGNAAIGADAAKQARRPNILVIFTDDQTHSAIGYANDELKTPDLDTLARSGTIFDRAYVASPICAASRASIMTGLFPQQHGVAALNTKAFQPYRNDGEKAHLTLARQLGKLGYASAFYGKSHLGPPTDYGFDQGREVNGYDEG